MCVFSFLLREREVSISERAFYKLLKEGVTQEIYNLPLVGITHSHPMIASISTVLM